MTLRLPSSASVKVLLSRFVFASFSRFPRRCLHARSPRRAPCRASRKPSGQTSRSEGEPLPANFSSSHSHSGLWGPCVPSLFRFIFRWFILTGDETNHLANRPGSIVNLCNVISTRACDAAARLLKTLQSHNSTTILDFISL